MKLENTLIQNYPETHKNTLSSGCLLNSFCQKRVYTASSALPLWSFFYTFCIDVSTFWFPSNVKSIVWNSSKIVLFFNYVKSLKILLIVIKFNVSR